MQLTSVKQPRSPCRLIQHSDPNAVGAYCIRPFRFVKESRQVTNRVADGHRQKEALRNPWRKREILSTREVIYAA